MDPAAPPDPKRRELVKVALAGAGAAMLPACRSTDPRKPLIGNITGLYPVSVARVAKPRTTDDVRQALAGWPGQVSVGGARCSMGGQTALRDSLHLDMRGMNRLVWLKPEEKCARVQAGMSWRGLQSLIDIHGLAVHTMQSYSNFSVGGSVSVNVHGRYVGHGPIAGSIRALQLVLADGRVVDATRDGNAELFHAAIGGYGAVGVITEIELALDDNSRIERRVEPVEFEAYPDWYATRVAGDAGAVLHNADVYPPDFESLVAITWRNTEKSVTVDSRLRREDGRYMGKRSAIWAISELPGGRALREHIIAPKQLRRAEVVWRNYEASLDIDELEPFSRFMSTYALQEYFVPMRNFLPFAKALRRIVRRHHAEVLNLSVRHSPADAGSIMSWAREEVFCFVLYYKQRVMRESQRQVGAWTRELIDAALEHEGSYYLPYQLHATEKQFARAYPRADTFRAIKAQYDPAGRFSNEMWRKYLGW